MVVVVLAKYYSSSFIKEYGPSFGLYRLEDNVPRMDWMQMYQIILGASRV